LHSYKNTKICWKVLNNNTLALLSQKSIIIYEYNINNNNIKPQYCFYKIEDKAFSGSRLPIIDTKDLIKLANNDISFFIELLESTINYNIRLVEYGQTLLQILTKSTKPELTRYIELIYSKCTTLVKED